MVHLKKWAWSRKSANPPEVEHRNDQRHLQWGTRGLAIWILGWWWSLNLKITRCYGIFLICHWGPWSIFDQQIWWWAGSRPKTCASASGNEQIIMYRWYMLIFRYLPSPFLISGGFTFHGNAVLWMPHFAGESLGFHRNWSLHRHLAHQRLCLIQYAMVHTWHI